MSLLEELDEFPPLLCRILAREKRRALTITEIAGRAKMSPIRVAFILRLKSWATIEIEDASKLMDACGLSRANKFRAREYLKRNANSKRPFLYMANLGRQRLRQINKHLKAEVK